MELVRLRAAMLLQQTERTKEMEEQVRKDLDALGKILPLTEESVEMMEVVRDEVATMLQQRRQKGRKEKEDKEKLLREIEREIKSRVES